MTRTSTWATIGLLAILLTGCTSTDPPVAEPTPSASQSPTAVPQPSPSETATISPTESPESPAATCKPFGTTDETTSDDPQTMSTMTGESMRLGRHDCFERFVFDLQGNGPTPGWTVGYRDPLAGQGSGEAISLKGDADLEVIIQVWTVDDFEGRPPEWQPFTGPDDIVTQGYTAIKEARNLYAYEGATQIGLGVDRERPFRVSWIDDGSRLVVDVYTGVPID